MGNDVSNLSLVDFQGITHRVPERQPFISWSACGQGYDDSVHHELREDRDVDCMACIAAGCRPWAMFAF